MKETTLNYNKGTTPAIKYLFSRRAKQHKSRERTIQASQNSDA